MDYLTLGYGLLVFIAALFVVLVIVSVQDGGVNASASKASRHNAGKEDEDL